MKKSREKNGNTVSQDISTEIIEKYPKHLEQMTKWLLALYSQHIEILNIQVIACFLTRLGCDPSKYPTIRGEEALLIQLDELDYCDQEEGLSDQEKKQVQFSKKLRAHLDNNAFDTICNIDVKNLNAFHSLLIIFKYLVQMTQQAAIKPLPADEAITINLYCSAIIGKANEFIGYLTAKTEESRRNAEGGAKAKKEKGRKNQEALKRIMEDLEIPSLNIFRKDKKLRDRFIDSARKETDSLSPKRIFDLARAIQKEKNIALDTKPPA